VSNPRAQCSVSLDTEGDAGNGAITMFDVDVDNPSIADGFYNVTNVSRAVVVRKASSKLTQRTAAWANRTS